MPPVHAPIPDAKLLEKIVDDWLRAGWSLDDLRSFRMEGEDGPTELDDLSDDEVAALEKLTDDDKKSLSALPPHKLASLIAEASLDARIRDARGEAVKSRREYKPWKELGKELGMTPEQIRDAVKKAGKPPKKDGDGDGGDNKPEVDADDIARKARADADAVANRRVVRAEVKVLARDIFADPDDAPLYLDLDDFEVDDDGDLVDKDELVAALKKVITDKPHLAKKPAAGKKDKAQGERDHDAKPSVSRGKEMFENRKKPTKADA